MKLSRKEFEAQLALAKSLTGDAKKTMVDSLKAADVFDLVEGKEVAVHIELDLIDGDGQKALAQPGLTAEQVQDIVAKAMKGGTKAPVIGQPDAGAFVMPKNVRRQGNLKAFVGEIDGKGAMERAYHSGQWILAACGNEKAKQFCTDHGMGLKLHSEGTNTAGGYLVPEEFGTDMIALMEKYGIVRRLFKVRQMMSDTRSDPRRTGGLTAYFVGEGTAGTESNKGWDRVALVAKKLMVLTRISSELGEDAVINIADDLVGEIALAFATLEDNCGLVGTGTAAYGGIVGVCQKLTDINGVDEGGGVILGSGNTFAELVLSDFNRTVARIPQYADNANTAWVAHRSFYYGTMQRLELAAGGVTASEIRQGNRTPLFLGYPVEISPVMPASDVNSQIVCTFGDHQAAATFGDRRSTSIKFSDAANVGGESTFERDEIAVKGTERADINVHDVGTSTVAGPVVGLISAAS